MQQDENKKNAPVSGVQPISEDSLKEVAGGTPCPRPPQVNIPGDITYECEAINKDGEVRVYQ